MLNYQKVFDTENLHQAQATEKVVSNDHKFCLLIKKGFEWKLNPMKKSWNFV